MRALAASCVSDKTFLNLRRDSREDDDGLASEVDGRGDSGTCEADDAGGSVEGRWTSDEAARRDTDDVPHLARSTWWLRRGSLGGRAAGGCWTVLSLRVQRSGLIGIVAAEPRGYSANAGRGHCGGGQATLGGRRRVSRCRGRGDEACGESIERVGRGVSGGLN
jgi:hypothetical protein